MAETKTQRSGILVILTALFAAFCGLYLLIGGVWLVSLGGSWYYPIAGVVCLASPHCSGGVSNLHYGCMPRCCWRP
jgi:hypothetical protein